MLVFACASGSAVAGKGRGGHRGHGVGHTHHQHARSAVFVGFPLLLPWGYYPGAAAAYPAQPSVPLA